MTTVKFSSDTADGSWQVFFTPRPQVLSRISSIKSVEGAIVSQFAVDICWCIYRAVGWRGCSYYMNPSLENQEKGHLEIWSWSKDPYEPISVNVMQAVVCRIVLSRVKPYSAARGYGMFFWDSFIEKTTASWCHRVDGWRRHRNQWDFQGPPIMGPLYGKFPILFPYHSHKNPSRSTDFSGSCTRW